MLDVQGLNKAFGGLRAVRDIDASFERGKITAIIGPNGAGKTTFFNLVAGAIRPTSGRILLKGEEMTGLRADLIARRGVARTFQTTALFDHASVLDNLIVGHRLRTRSGFWDALIGSGRLAAEERECRRKAEEALDFVGLSHIGNRLAADVSQDERKRIAFALALTTEPELLLADEPAGGVNPDETNGLAALMRKIVATGVTLILIEHKMRMVMELADKIIVLDHGEKIADGTPQDIRSHQRVIDAYLGADHAAAH
ncbi:MAG: ABC transporter ATP-binding protein [Beijerinckiaceae bacterium]|nr:ABC transporter ATP-binding protein [Beijerinckiaceae bacterium]